MDSPDKTAAGPETADGIPTIELHDPEQQTLRVLRTLQAALLKHPVAAQAAFNALIAEGRAFAGTSRGQLAQAALERSSLLHRARLVFDFSTLSLLEQEPPDIMPSAYIDALFMLGSSARSDEILQELFRAEGRDDPKRD